MMDPFVRLEAVAAPMLRDDVDTDAILPVAHMKSMDADLGPSLFANLRYRSDGSENPEFVLNRREYRDARILVAARNFGCGSSREHAVWALLAFGIRCVVAESFGDIFYDNRVHMGLLPIVLPHDSVRALASEVVAAAGARPTLVELAEQRVTGPEGTGFVFTIDAHRKRILLEGLDAIGATLLLAAEVRAFQERDRERRPWIHAIEPRADRARSS